MCRGLEPLLLDYGEILLFLLVYPIIEVIHGHFQIIYDGIDGLQSGESILKCLSLQDVSHPINPLMQCVDLRPQSRGKVDD